MGEAASVSGGDPNQTGGGFVHLRVRSAYSLLEGAIKAGEDVWLVDGAVGEAVSLPAILSWRN